MSPLLFPIAVFLISLQAIPARDETLPRDNPDPLPVGFAGVSALGVKSTTGGKGGPVKTVSSVAELESLLEWQRNETKKKRAGPLTIRISGTLKGEGKKMIYVQDLAGVTLTGGDKGAVFQGIGLFIKRSSNVIIRNLTFEDCPDDGIACGWEETHHVWIDHCSFTDKRDGREGGAKHDGALDISGGASYITVSWCRFSNHHKTCLLGHSDKNGRKDRGRLKTTYHHNWFEGTLTRHPRVRFAECHVFNNYYVGNEYGIASTMEADVVVEGNYFDRVEHPTRVGYGNSAPGDLVERHNVYRECDAAPETRGKAFDPGKYYRFTLDPADKIPALVSRKAGAPR